MSIDIRQADEDDLDHIIELNGIVQAKHAGAYPWLFKQGGLARDAISRLIASPAHHLLIASSSADGVPAGYALGEIRKIPETSLTHAYAIMHVHHIAVKASSRKGGIGRALVEHLATIARQDGVERLSADVWAFNDEARSFFGKSGLEPYIMRMWR